MQLQDKKKKRECGALSELGSSQAGDVSSDREDLDAKGNGEEHDVFDDNSPKSMEERVWEEVFKECSSRKAMGLYA